MKKILTLVTGLALLSSCSSDEELISPTPAIEFVSLGSSSVTAFSEPLVFTISYRDGDGDLGENDPDVKNCYITDSRNSVTYEFRIPELAPSGSEIIIDGDLNIELQSVGISDDVDSESATFSIYVTDRAGNVSNTVTSSSVGVSR